ncbi:hypothetical protein ACFXHA_21810 [Nocardia sp. NPDC059240]|uniref:hypothetical protein n=1 Tax=Nocardia sp. NPDC059240 TaxID=3346786 RepID=UPI00369F6239
MGLVVVAPGAAVLTPMGMDKSGDLPVGKDTSGMKVSGWAARSGYPDTVISAGNNEILLSTSGAGIARCRVTLTAGWNPGVGGGGFRVSLMQNTTEIKAADFAVSALFVALPDTPVTVQPGDRLWLAVSNTTTSFLGVTATVKGGSGTYVTFDAV